MCSKKFGSSFQAPTEFFPIFTLRFSMKRKLSLILFGFLAVGLVSCGKKEEAAQENVDQQRGERRDQRILLPGRDPDHGAAAAPEHPAAARFTGQEIESVRYYPSATRSGVRPGERIRADSSPGFVHASAICHCFASSDSYKPSF